MRRSVANPATDSSGRQRELVGIVHTLMNIGHICVSERGCMRAWDC
jgi:hypothetical protein